MIITSRDERSAGVAGTLYVVATPIGNLADIGARALQVLGQVAAICAEDTRHTRQLLAAHGLERPLLALHEHNEEELAWKLVERMRGGDSLALVSDAGTPLVSDPGYRLVREARAAGVKVSPVPGACAAIAALSVAGIPSDRFCFEGFLPAKSSARKEKLVALLREPRTLVFYESAHRIEDSLADLGDVFGHEREAVLARELTKVFETVLGDSVGSLLEKVRADENQRKGEFVLIVRGAPDDGSAALAEGKRLFARLKEDLPPSKAAKLAAELSGASRKDLYET
jgi:16S rRNA (cytidine1402-2'-O)-methyltransferase